MNVCPAPFLKFKNWQCISEAQCRNKETFFHGMTIQDKNKFKSYNDECIEYCPCTAEYCTKEKEHPTLTGSLTCEYCENCPMECLGGRITSLDELKKFQGCTMIKGDLSIQLSGCTYTGVYMYSTGWVTQPIVFDD